MSDERPPEVPRGFADLSAYQPPTTPDPAPPAPTAAAAPRRRRGGRRPLVLGLVALLVVVVVVAVVVRSGDDDGSKLAADGTPGAAVVRWTTAMADQDYQQACDEMAARSVELIAANGPTCPKALATMDPDGRYARGDETEVVETTVKGDRAEVTVVLGGPAGARQLVVVRKEDGRWKASPFDVPAAAGTTTTELAPSKDPQSDIDDASAAVCELQISSTETAVDAYQALNGKVPADVDALVDAGLLTEAPEGVRVTDGEVTGTGPCA